MVNFQNGGRLSKLSCDSSNKGKMIFVKDSSAIFFVMKTTKKQIIPLLLLLPHP